MSSAFYAAIPALSPFPACPASFPLGDNPPGENPLGEKSREELVVLLALAAREAHEGPLGLAFEVPPPARLVAHARRAKGPAKPKARPHPELRAAEEAEGQQAEFGREGDPAPPSDRAYEAGFEALCLLAGAEAPLGSVGALGRMFSAGFPAYVESANGPLGARLAFALGLP